MTLPYLMYLISKLPPYDVCLSSLQFSADTNESMSQWISTINLLSGLQRKGRYETHEKMYSFSNSFVYVPGS